MELKREYKIISSFSQAEFEEKVNEAMKDGAFLLGPPFLNKAPVSDCESHWDRDRFNQAVILRFYMKRKFS